ncbi:hypothetical protein SAMN05444064_107192 [Pseudomonas syringae]|nr:hypothetical protein SAMN05444514_10747 [Pseudomonas syringae]SFM01162.1 hypothetical protein SAMN05444064_107192 [Pseudomonas syringae]
MTLRVTDLRRAAHSRSDAERPERHAHAEHGHDSVLPGIYRPACSGPDTYRSSRSRVGMPWVTLRVIDLHRAAHSRSDAERPEGHAHAEHGHDSVLPGTYRSVRFTPDTYRSSRSSVGMPWVTLRVIDLHRAAHSRSDAERPEGHAHAEHGHDSVLPGTYRSVRFTPDTYRSSRSSVGMPWVTLRVIDLHRAAHSRSDAERPEGHAHAEHGHDSVLPGTYRSVRSSPDTYRSSRSSVGMPWVTLRVTDLRRAAHSGSDAERRTIVKCLSV